MRTSDWGLGFGMVVRGVETRDLAALVLLLILASGPDSRFRG